MDMAWGFDGYGMGFRWAGNRFESSAEKVRMVSEWLMEDVEWSGELGKGRVET